MAHICFGVEKGDKMSSTIAFNVIIHANMLEIKLKNKYAIECRSEEHTSELQSHSDLVCRLLLEKKKKKN